MSLIKRLFVFSLVVTTVLWSSAVGLTVKAEGSYGAGSLLALEGVSGAAVYYIGADGMKYVFPDVKTYNTWYSNFNDVVRVPVSELDMYADGGAVTYRAGTKLVTHENTAKIYAVGPGGMLHWIPTAEVAENLYGANWGSRVLDVIPGYFSSSYTSSSDLSTMYPSGTLLQMGETMYYVDGTDVRPFADADAFEANNFSYDNVIEVSDVSGYGTGESITGEETGLSGFMPVEGGSSTPGSGPGSLTVSLASDTPASGIVVGSAARVPFTKVKMMNTGAYDVTVDQVIVERMGLSQDAAFSSLDLLDGSTMLPLNNSSKTLGSVHTASFNDDFVVPAGTTKYVYLAANMASSLLSYAGETPILGVKSVTLANGTVSGSFPVAGNYQTINGTLSVGSATVTAGGNNPSAATKEVGTTDYTVTSVKVTAGSAEDLTINRIIFTNNGSGDPEDVENIELINANTNAVLGTKASISGDSIDFNNLNITLEKGKSVTFDLRLDIIGGSGSTFSYDIDKQADISVMGDTYGYMILPSYSNSAEPYFDANNTTGGDGSLRIESVAVTPSNITEGLSDVTLGKFKFVAKGEPVNITSIGWNFVFATSGTTFVSDLTNVTVYDEDGTAVAGPVDPVSTIAAGSTATATTTDTITIPVGETIFTVEGDLSTDWTANDTIQAGVMAGDIIAKGDVTGNTIGVTPSGNTQSTSLTVKSAALAVSVSSNPAAQTVVSGAQDLLVAQFILDASVSGDDVEVTAIKPVLHTTANSYPNQVSGWTLTVDGTDLTIDSESTTCTGSNCNTAGAEATTTLTIADNDLIVPAGESKVVEVRVDVGTGATSGTFNVGVQSGSVTAVDSDAQTVTPTYTVSDGQAMTLATGGTLNVAVLTDPVAADVVGGSTTEVGRFTMQAKYEGVDINSLGFTVQAPDGGIVGNQDELTNLQLWEDGGSQLGSIAVNAANVTITPSSMGLDVNEEKTYVVKAVFAGLSDSSPASSGAGLKVLLSNVDVDGTAVGSSSVTVSGTGSAFSTFSVFKSLPTVAQIDFSGAGNITTNGIVNLKKFSVSADSAGPVGLYKVSFGVSTSTVSLSTTGFYLYESSSSGTLGDIIAKGSDCTLTEAAADGVSPVTCYLDVNDDNAHSPAYEHRVISAGSTKYYTFRGTLSGHTAATSDSESVSTVFAGDPAFAGTSALNADAVAATAQPDFVWSDLNFDLYSTSTATVTAGWFNGYRVPGMDTTSSTAQVISD